MELPKIQVAGAMAPPISKLFLALGYIMRSFGYHILSHTKNAS
jgi:hypothetical protein